MNAPLVPAPESRARWNQVERLGQAVARLEGHRESAATQASELEKVVSVAKGRLNARPIVDAFLDQVQVDQNRRNVSSFETLLTALAQEVLLGVSPIKLELTTERNLPSLDVVVERAGGQREDVFEDQGGGLTNVVVAGLRLIAVVKSGSARIVAFDEPDCWISTDRVPAFFRVLEDASRRLGIQCFVVTHHDVRSFGLDIHVSRIEGHPDTGVSVVAETQPAPWPDPEAPGLRWMRLRDVQGYEDATLTLSPGLSVLTGPNGHGKSTVSRAFRAVFFGESRDSLVRHGAKLATVELGVENGRVLRFVRQPKRNPVNVWSLHEADGAVVEENGVRYETGGRSVPEWVGERFGIYPIQDLDVHIAHQKRPVFLLSDPPSKRASVLSIGQESDYARRMIVLQRERCKRDQATVRDGEREIDQKRRVVAHLRGLDPLKAEIEDLRARLGEIDTAMANLSLVDAALDRLSRARRGHEAALLRREALQDLPSDAALAAALEGVSKDRARQAAFARLSQARARDEAARRRREALAGLPGDADLASLEGKVRDGKAREAVAARLVEVLDLWSACDARARVLDALPDTAPEIRRADAMIPAGRAVAEARKGLARATARGAVLAAMPAAVPAVGDTAAREEANRRLRVAATALAAAEAKGTDLAGREAGLRSDLDALLEKAGGQCPACGQPVADATMLVEGHRHSA